MRHPLRVISGDWADRVDAAFSGSVIYSQNDRIPVEQVTRAQVVLDGDPEQPGQVIVEIETAELSMVVEMSVRAFQSLAARSTAQVQRATATARNQQLQAQLTRYQSLDKTTRKCRGQS